MERDLNLDSKKISIARFKINDAAEGEDAGGGRKRPLRLEEGGVWTEGDDWIGREEILEIRLEYPTTPIGARSDTDVSRMEVWTKKSLAVTLRTPGFDRELVAGFLVTEGILKKRSDLLDISFCGSQAVGSQVIKARLSQDVTVILERMDRSFAVNSACGACGKKNKEALVINFFGDPSESIRISPLKVDPRMILTLPQRMLKEQVGFGLSGGLHGAAVFDLKDQLLASFEDIGRHNAVDKVVGNLLFSNLLPASDKILVVSGRAGYELVQKGLSAGFRFMIAVGAPSSLAVETAQRYGMTLVGFTKRNQFNVYSGLGVIS